MAYGPDSPNPDNYFIGKGVLKFLPTGASEYIHLGNCPEIEYTPTLDVLDHFSSMAGIRSKDKKVVREKAATVRAVMEELTPYNLSLALLGSLDATGSPTGYTIDIFSLAEITGKLRFIGGNDIGPKVQYDWNNVSIIPSSSINLISEEWASMEFTADVLVDGNGKFGTATWGISGEVDTGSP